MVKGSAFLCLQLLCLLSVSACQGISVPIAPELPEQIRQTQSEISDEDWKKLVGVTTDAGREAAKKEKRREQRLEDRKKPVFASYAGLGGEIASSDHLDPSYVVLNFQMVLIPAEWRVGFEAGVTFGSVTDLSFGLRYILPLSEDEKTRIEAGAGLSYRQVEITHTRRQCFLFFFCNEEERKQKGDDTGLYFHAGLFRELDNGWDVGIDVRFVHGSDVTLEPISDWRIPGRTGDLNSTQILLLVGKRL